MMTVIAFESEPRHSIVFRRQPPDRIDTRRLVDLLRCTPSHRETPEGAYFASTLAYAIRPM